jgi:hypothetical protein
MTYGKDKVDEVFRKLAAGEISPSAPGVESSGWETTLPSGKRVVRSVLEAEAKPLIALGPEAVPDLLPWVTNVNAALGYVAIHALQEITGERPYVPYFDLTDAEGHRKKAIEVWRKWHEDVGRGP